MTRTGEVGSIGVVAVHIDESGADAKAGLAWTFVFAGDRKIDANAHEPLSQRARATIQADVDRLYAEFCAVVAANRTISSEAARGTNAAIYRGELAVRAGLADRVGTLDLAIAEMPADPRIKSRIKSGNDRAALTPRAISNPIPKRSPSMKTNETESAERKAKEAAPASEAAHQPPAQPAALPEPAAVSQLTAVSEPATLPAPEPMTDPAFRSAVADKLRAEFSEIAAITAQAARLGVTIDAADAIRKGIAPDALRRSVLDTLASRAAATSVIATAPATPTVGESPIVCRARERAAAARG